MFISLTNEIDLDRRVRRLISAPYKVPWSLSDSLYDTAFGRCRVTWLSRSTFTTGEQVTHISFTAMRISTRPSHEGRNRTTCPDLTPIGVSVIPTRGNGDLVGRARLIVTSQNNAGHVPQIIRDVTMLD
jgi:hypothetical protein